MNKLLIALNALLAAAVVVLFVMFAGIKKQVSTPDGDAGVGEVTGAQFPIAYINVDSLLLNYDLSVNSNEELIKKEEDVRLEINTKMRRLQSEAAEFQRKLENNAFLSRDRAEQAQNTLMKKERDLQELQAKLSQELLEEQQKMSAELRDTINNFLEEYNKEKQYHMIISNTAGDNILIAKEEQYDITSDVVNRLNERYNK